MKKYLFCLLAFLPLCSFGAVEPVIIGFSSPNDVYTVPEGKVLLIEHIGWDDTSSPYGLEIGLELSSATSTNLLAMDNFYGAHDPVGDIVGVISFSRPLKIPENTSIRLVDVDFSSDTYTICGVLADTSDLYASIESQSEGMLCQGGMFQFDVLASSSRPGTLKLSGSTNLKEWQSISSAQIAKTDTDKFSVTVPTEDRSKYFVKPSFKPWNNNKTGIGVPFW